MREHPQICAIVAPLRAGDHRISAAFLNDFTAKPAPELVAVNATPERAGTDKPSIDKPASDKTSDKVGADKAGADKSTTPAKAADKNDKIPAAKPAPSKLAAQKPNKPQVRKLIVESLNIDGAKNA